MLYCRYIICHDDLCIEQTCVFLWKYSLSMGYATTSLYIQNSFVTPPQNKNDWVHSVVFEPQPKMQLIRSSYKITSFLDFQPFLQGFQSVDKYIKDLMTDILITPLIFRNYLHHFVMFK